MSTDLNRKINIWINDKQVENTFKGLTNAMRQSRNELAKMTIGSKEYVEKTRQIKQLQGLLDQHRKAQGQVAQGWTKIAGAIKQIAIGNIIAGVFEKITSSLSGAFGKITTAISDFEGGMTNVFTLMDDESIMLFGDQMKEGAKQVSAMGFAMNDVTKSMFDAVSAGVDAGNSVEFLNQAAVLAKGGVTSLSTSVDGLTTILNAYGLEASETQNISDAFFTAQKYGKTTVDELAQSVGKAAPLANSLGISYQELLSSISQLTLAGISTRESVTYLKSAFANLLKPSSDAEKVFNKLGIPFGATQIKAVGFTQTLERLNKVIQEHPDEIAKAIPSVEALTAIQALSGEKLESYKNILDEVQNDIGTNSSLQKAYAKQMESFPNVMAAAREKLNTFAVTLGEKLAPYIKEVVPLISGWTKKVIELFGWIERNSETLKKLGAIILKVAVAVGVYTAVQKIKIAWEKIQIATTLAVTAAQNLFNKALKATPWALAIAGIAAVVTGVGKLIEGFKSATLYQQNFSDAQTQSKKLMIEDAKVLQGYKDKLMDVNTTQEERKKIINQINSQYGQYLPNLLDEKASYQDISTALGTINEQLTKKYQLQALEEKAVELQKQKIDLEKELSETKEKTSVKWLQKAMDYGDKVRSYITGTALIMSNRTRTDVQNDLNKVADAYALMVNDIENINKGIKTFERNSTGEVDNGTPPIIPPGGDESEEEKKKKKMIDALKEYKKAWEDLQNTILDIRKKANYATLTEEERAVAEINDKYQEQLDIVDRFIIELQAKEKTKEGLNQEELELLKKFYTQKSQLIILREEELSRFIEETEKKRLEETKKKLAGFKDAAKDAFKAAAETKPQDDPWEDLKEKIEKVIYYASLAKEALGSFFSIQSSKEQEALNEFEANTEKKKELLQKQLDKSIITQENYNARVSELDKKMEIEKKKFAISEAKRQKKIRYFETILNTASAIAEALPNIPLSIAIGALGALQIAAIAREPLPKMAKGARVNKPTIAQVGEAGPEIVLSNKIVSSPSLGPIADDLARIQEGKQPRFLNRPSSPNYGGMSSAIGTGGSGFVTNNTVINQVDNKSIDAMTWQVQEMQKLMKQMTDAIKDPKYRRSVISYDDMTEFDEDEKIRLRYSGV